MGAAEGSRAVAFLPLDLLARLRLPSARSWLAPSGCWQPGEAWTTARGCLLGPGDSGGRPWWHCLALVGVRKGLFTQAGGWVPASPGLGRLSCASFPGLPSSPVLLPEALAGRPWGPPTSPLLLPHPPRAGGCGLGCGVGPSQTRLSFLPQCLHLLNRCSQRGCGPELGVGRPIARRAC